MENIYTHVVAQHFDLLEARLETHKEISLQWEIESNELRLKPPTDQSLDRLNIKNIVSCNQRKNPHNLLYI